MVIRSPVLMMISSWISSTVSVIISSVTRTSSSVVSFLDSPDTLELLESEANRPVSFTSIVVSSVIVSTRGSSVSVAVAHVHESDLISALRLNY